MVTVTVRVKRRLLRAATAAMLAAAGASAWLLAPRQAGLPAGGGSGAGEPSGVSVAGPAVGPIGDYAAIWERELRKPLYDPKPVEPAARPPEKPKLLLTLTGTMIEPGFSMASVRTAAGEEKLVAVGEVVADAEVVEIAPGAVTVRFGGDLITLRVNPGGA